MCHLYRLRIKTHVLNLTPCIVLSRDKNNDFTEVTVDHAILIGMCKYFPNIIKCFTVKRSLTHLNYSTYFCIYRSQVRIFIVSFLPQIG